jgi:hypothetical protein
MPVVQQSTVRSNDDQFFNRVDNRVGVTSSRNLIQIDNLENVIDGAICIINQSSSNAKRLFCIEIS